MFQVLIRAAAVAVVASALAGCEVLDVLTADTPGEVASREARTEGYRAGWIKGQAQATGEKYREDPEVTARRQSDPAFAAGFQKGVGASFDSALSEQGFRLGQAWYRAQPSSDYARQYWLPDFVDSSDRNVRAWAEAVGLSPQDWRLRHKSFRRGIWNGALRGGLLQNDLDYRMGGPDAAGDAGDAGGD